MADNTYGDFFLSEIDDELFDDEAVTPPPVVVPSQAVGPAVVPSVASVPAPLDLQMVPPAAPVATQPSVAPSRVPVAVGQPTREDRLADALNRLMEESQDVEAAALVSLDGFTMASALPEGMQEDRVGAMSAAILGLGERAAAELGKGRLTQVFIEGEDGYVVLIAAGSRGVLTCLVGAEAKLGLVLYDMRVAASEIAAVLG